MSDIKNKIKTDLQRIQDSAENIGAHAATHAHQVFAASVSALADHIEKIEKALVKDNKQASKDLNQK